MGATRTVNARLRLAGLTNKVSMASPARSLRAPLLAPPLSPVHHLEFELQRVEYEAMIASLLEKTLDCVHQSLNDAKLNPQDIHKIMLVGGATRTPLVHRLLHERLGLEPRFEINPDLIVAMGAAIQAGVMAGEKSHSILVDITPHTYSTSALRRTGFSGEMMCVPIIPRNTPLPAGKSELFFTVMDEQEKAEVTVFQGESDKPEENNFIGNFLVENLAKVPAGNPLVIHYDLDVNGLLKVTATEKNTGVAKTAVLDTRGAHALDVSEARRNIASLIGNATGGEPVDTGTDGDAGAEALAGSEDILITAKDLRKRAEAVLPKNLDAADAQEIRALVHAAANAIKERDWDALAKNNEALGDLLFYLED